jgi:hypothetical protein
MEALEATDLFAIVCVWKDEDDDLGLLGGEDEAAGAGVLLAMVDDVMQPAVQRTCCQPPL